MQARLLAIFFFLFSPLLHDPLSRFIGQLTENEEEAD